MTQPTSSSMDRILETTCWRTFLLWKRSSEGMRPQNGFQPPHWTDICKRQGRRKCSARNTLGKTSCFTSNIETTLQRYKPTSLIPA